MKTKVGSYAVYEPSEEGWQEFEQQLAQVNADVASHGLEIISAPEAVFDDESCHRVAAWFRDKDIDALHALIVSWSFDHYTVEIQQANPVPVAIRAIPGIRSGSIVGAQQLGCVLADLDVPHRLFFGALGDNKIAESTADFIKAAGIQKKLKGARFGVIGRRTEGMTPIAVDEVEILRLFGLRLIHIGMDEFQPWVEQIPWAEAESAWDDIASKARGVECSRQEAIESVRNYLALKKIIREFDLQGLSIGSYPYCQGRMCLPISLLNHEGIATGCEGDVNSTIAMYILNSLSESPVHFGEMLDIEEQSNSIVSSHCGAAALSIADARGYMLCPVRLAHCGVCVRFSSKPGPITYVNFVGRKGNYRLCALQGEALPTEMVFEGNPMRIALRAPLKEIWEIIDRFGFGHHWMAAYGHYASVLAELCKLVGIRGVFPDLDEIVEGR